MREKIKTSGILLIRVLSQLRIWSDVGTLLYMVERSIWRALICGAGGEWRE
jgi:hypothetical protein